MKNTVNIFEELNKMKNLIHVKRGTVISEQNDPFSCIKSDLDKKNIDFLKEGLFKNASSILDWLTNDKNIKAISPYQEEIRNNFDGSFVSGSIFAFSPKHLRSSRLMMGDDG